MAPGAWPLDWARRQITRGDDEVFLVIAGEAKRLGTRRPVTRAGAEESHIATMSSADRTRQPFRRRGRLTRRTRSGIPVRMPSIRPWQQAQHAARSALRYSASIASARSRRPGGTRLDGDCRAERRDKRGPEGQLRGPAMAPIGAATSPRRAPPFRSGRPRPSDWTRKSHGFQRFRRRSRRRGSPFGAARAEGSSGRRR